jgi:hypothetical protein
LSDKTEPTEVGKNRTGAARSPQGSKAMQKAAEEAAGEAAGGVEAMDEVRLQFSQAADPVGTMPPPLTVKGVARSALSAIKGEKPTVFLDKLGERLAFERTGVRLYEALGVKLRASHTHDPSITIEALREIHDDELRHAGILALALEKMGADPTAMTPCADVTGVAASGVVQVLTDPRSTLTQCLNTMLMVELGDNASWELLMDLAAQLGHDDLADQFRVALTEEQRHVALVRGWLTTAVLGQAGVEAEAPAPPP